MIKMEKVEWISVKDRLPKKYDRVLVTNGEQICLHFKQSRWDLKGEEGNDLYCACDLNYDQCQCIEGSITHWMPLPDKPNLIQPVLPENSGKMNLTVRFDRTFETKSMKADRLEDIGRIREILGAMLDKYNFFDDCTSKHTVDSFIEKYGNEEKLADLHDELRWMTESLHKIHYISIGENFD